jgi:hypothetical protein
MKKNLQLLINTIAILTLLIPFSCKKDLAVKTIVPPTVSATTLKNKYFVPLDIASAVATQVTNSHLVSTIIAKQTVRFTPGLSTKQILDSLAVPDNANPSYYIFNYVGGGFAIISADKRVEPVLSFSDNGYFPHSGKLPRGLVNWLAVIHKNMQLLRKDTILKAPVGVANLWTELRQESKTRNRLIDVAQQPPPPCQPTYSSYTVGPLLQTTWGQGQPYNYLCPVGSYDGGHWATGCVATAMAQVMYYWKYPASYNWNLMPLSYNAFGVSYPGNRDVSQLMLDIGTSVKMTYGNGGSYPQWWGFVQFGPINCSDALKDSFGFHSSSDATYNYLNVVSNLNVGEPVILGATEDNTTILFWSFGADGHAWVCDGYQQVNTTWCPSGDSPGGGEGFLYLHMNWGWDGLSNDWFDFDYWSVFDGTTQKYWVHNQIMSYNIHP